MATSSNFSNSIPERAEAMRVEVLVIRQYDVVEFLDVIGCFRDIDVTSPLRLQSV